MRFVLSVRLSPILCDMRLKGEILVLSRPGYMSCVIVKAGVYL